MELLISRINVNLVLVVSICVMLAQSRPQQNEEAMYPKPPVQIERQVLVEILPKSLHSENIENVTAKTQEILAKIDAVNRQHGYRKPEPKRTHHYVPGYFTHDYNYKERVLKGFHLPENVQTDIENLNDINHNYHQQIQNRLQGLQGVFLTSQDVHNTQVQQRLQDFKQQIKAPLVMAHNQHMQAQSVEYVRNIIENYPLGPIMQPVYYQPYPYQPYDIHSQQGLQGGNIYPLTATPNFNPFNSYVNYATPTVEPYQQFLPPPSETMSAYPHFASTLNNVPNIVYNSFWVDFGSNSEEPEQLPKCKTSVEADDVKRAPKILDKIKIPGKSSRDIPIINSDEVTTEKPSVHHNRYVIENIDIPATADNKTQLYKLLNTPASGNHSRRKDNGQNPRNTKRPSIFKPHTWFNNQKISMQNQSDLIAETAESASLESESDKGFINHRKKLFSKDNTGSGIFIHKLKVRKGGVAIAGPGGIATAGSGGTAIVGPNGYAFTHPDSLAIAGSGTKVIAVDPHINLSDLVTNGSMVNGTRLDSLTHARVGKVVATGPVIYYNKG